MKLSNISYLFILFFFLQALAIWNKILSLRMAKEVMRTKKLPLWPLIIPIGYVTRGAEGDEAIRISRSYAIVADLFLWFSILGFIVLALILIGA